MNNQASIVYFSYGGGPGKVIFDDLILLKRSQAFMWK